MDRVEAKPAAECVDESMPRILAFRAIDNRSTTGKSSEGAIRSLIKGLAGVDPGLLRRCSEHQAGKIRNKLLREWEWAEVPPGEISPTFRELYKEYVGDRYGDADGSSRGRTVTTALFGDPNALV